MTLPSSLAHQLGARLPADRDREVANQLRQIISSNARDEDGTVELDVRQVSGETARVTLTPVLSDLLMDMLRHIGSGKAVTLVPVGQQLTTQQAADILNVSRPHFVKLLEDGILSFTKVGRHRRVSARELFDYKEKRDQTRKKALEEMALVDAEFL